jgi:hypothetical protein
MEKFLFLKTIQNPSSLSKLCSLPHKNVVMIYSCLISVGYLIFALNDRIFFYNNVPYFFIFLSSLISILSFALPTKKFELMKLFYFFNAILFYASFIIFIITSVSCGYELIVHEHYDLHVILPALLSFGIMIVILFFTFSIYCYIKENLKPSNVNDLVKVDSSQRKNLFLFTFKISEINVKKHQDRLEILSLLSLSMAVILFSYRIHYIHRQDSVNIISMIFGIFTVAITLSKNEDLFTLNYYFYIFHLFILTFFFMSNSNDVLIFIVKLIYILFQTKVCKEILIRSLIVEYENKKISEISSNPQELPSESRNENTYNINSINDSETLRNLETVQRDYAPPSLYNKI